MSENLRAALSHIKASGSPMHWANLVQKFQDRFRMDIDEPLDPKSPNSVDELISELASCGVEIIQAQGVDVVIAGVRAKIFPVPEYGWDGGSSIETALINMEQLCINDVGGGPMASLARRKDESEAGFALHHNCEIKCLHLFG